ncbi:MAG: hypothetical protein DMG88_03120 [Acidobacteria bacterium]|nr:MAG: hypothetical protein DMG88_03120 [Acidobacteriota bacterium]
MGGKFCFLAVGSILGFLSIFADRQTHPLSADPPFDIVRAFRVPLLPFVHDYEVGLDSTTDTFNNRAVTQAISRLDSFGEIDFSRLCVCH